MNNTLGQVKAALENVVEYLADKVDGEQDATGFTGNPEMRLSVECEAALGIISSIDKCMMQQGQAVDVESLRRKLESPITEYSDIEDYRLDKEFLRGWNACVDLISSKGLLRTNEIEPEGRGS
ncbi:MAG: hypothetical protein JWO78_308 [Micavibrio sp.]|nr:hypothetical protein [Micavibrio sp.]